MPRSFDFAIAQFKADAIRDERLNVALVVFGDRLSVHLPKNLDKLKAISGAVDVSNVRHVLEGLSDLDQAIQKLSGPSAAARLESLTDIAPVAFSELGKFSAESHESYFVAVDRLVRQLVEPEPAPMKQSRGKATKLFADVKRAFAIERVLAKKGEGLDAHRVVAHHKVAEGLEADLVLKNGAMHVIQTVDAFSEETSLKRAVSEVAVSALVFEQVRMFHTEQGTNAKLVYKANALTERYLSPSLHAAEHQGAHLINWESRDDRTRLIVELSSLADPLADVARGKRSGSIHASVQPKLKLH